MFVGKIKIAKTFEEALESYCFPINKQCLSNRTNQCLKSFCECFSVYIEKQTLMGALFEIAVKSEAIDFGKLTGLSTFVMKYVFRPAILKLSSLFSPYAGSTSNSPCRKLKVFSEMCTRLSEKSANERRKESNGHQVINIKDKCPYN